jgi:FMN phosphatase YigB (HAD superfamily)
MNALLFDFSRTLLFPKDPTDQRTLNQQHQALSLDPAYQFSDHFTLNEELLVFLHNLKGQLQLYIFTSGTMINNLPALRSKLTDFTKIYSGTELGLDKTEPSSYTWVAADINLPPGEILFIDDSQDNVQAALAAGLQAMVYKSNEEVMRKIGELNEE